MQVDGLERGDYKRYRSFFHYAWYLIGRGYNSLRETTLPSREAIREVMTKRNLEVLLTLAVLCTWFFYGLIGACGILEIAIEGMGGRISPAEPVGEEPVGEDYSDIPLFMSYTFPVWLTITVYMVYRYNRKDDMGY